MRENLRVRFAKRLLEGADRARGSDAEHLWKALRILMVKVLDDDDPVVCRKGRNERMTRKVVYRWPKSKKGYLGCWERECLDRWCSPPMDFFGDENPVGDDGAWAMCPDWGKLGV